MFKGDSKTFKYVSSREPISMTNTEPGPYNRAKVRVGAVSAGDVAISPAKSRPKKRNKILTDADDGLSMASVEWSSTTYNVEEIVQQFGSKFPVIVRTVKGYDQGGPDLEVNTGQILQLHSHGEQDRMKARMTRGSVISIPLSYPMDVRILDSGATSESMRFEHAIRKFPLPLRVLVLNIDESAPIGMVNITGQELVIVEGYEELFIKCNTIQEGWIEQNEVVVIPSFVDVIFSVAISMHGATQEEWEEYYKMFAFSVRHLNYKIVKGYEGVIFCKAIPRPVKHEEINVSVSQNSGTYANFPASPMFDRRDLNGRDRNGNPHHQQQHTPRQNQYAPQPQPQMIVYENLYSPEVPPKVKDIPPKSPKFQHPNQNKRPVQKQDILQARNNRDNMHKKQQSSNGQQSNQNNHAYVHDDGDDVQAMFDNVIQEAKSNHNLKTEEMKENASTVLDLVTRIQLSDTVERRIGEMNKKVHAQGNFVGSRFTGKTPRAVVQPTVHESPSSSSGGPFVTSVQLEPLPSQHRGANRAGNPSNHMNNSNKNGSNPGSTPFTRSESARHITSGPYDNVTVNQTSFSQSELNLAVSKQASKQPVKAAVSPIQRGTSVEHNPNVRYQTLDSIPTDIANLSLEEVCHFLTLLDMANHVRDFKYRQIDGQKLKDLKELDLLKKFNFTPFNASKLMRFLRGWRPAVS